MTDYRKYTDYIIEQAEKLLSIDSPSGYCRQVTDYLLEELDRLGIQAKRTVKGGVVASLAEEQRRWYSVGGTLRYTGRHGSGKLRQMAVSVLPISEV